MANNLPAALFPLYTLNYNSIVLKCNVSLHCFSMMLISSGTLPLIYCPASTISKFTVLDLPPGWRACRILAGKWDTVANGNPLAPPSTVKKCYTFPHSNILITWNVGIWNPPTMKCDHIEALKVAS